MAPATQALFGPAIQGLFQGSQPPRQVPSYLGMTNPYAGTTRLGAGAGNLYPYPGAYPGPVGAAQGTAGAMMGAPTNYTPLAPGATMGGAQAIGPNWGMGTQPYTPQTFTPQQLFGGQNPYLQQLTYAPRTPVEQALADVGQLAAGGGGQAAQEWGGGPFQEAHGRGWGGPYNVPWAAIEGMPDWRRQWEEWSWSERGIPLQGYEIFRLSRNVPPWGQQPNWGGGGGGGGQEAPVATPPLEQQWNPPASQWTF